MRIIVYLVKIHLCYKIINVYNNAIKDILNHIKKIFVINVPMNVKNVKIMKIIAQDVIKQQVFNIYKKIKIKILNHVKFNATMVFIMIRITYANYVNNFILN